MNLNVICPKRINNIINVKNNFYIIILSIYLILCLTVSHNIRTLSLRIAIACYIIMIRKYYFIIVEWISPSKCILVHVSILVFRNFRKLNALRQNVSLIRNYYTLWDNNERKTEAIFFKSIIISLATTGLVVHQ